MRTISISATNVRIGGGENSARGRRSMEDQEKEFTFVPAWRLHDPAVERDAQEFWRRLGLIHEAEIGRRLPELCAAAYAQGKIVAVATAEPFLLPHLRLRFLQYRCAVSPSFRRHEMAWRLSAFSYSLLEKWSLENPLENIAGLLATMQASEFEGHLGAPILSKHGLNLVFVGHTKWGHQLRAIWFKHANVEAMFQRTILDAPDLSVT